MLEIKPDMEIGEKIHIVLANLIAEQEGVNISFELSRNDTPKASLQNNNHPDKTA